MQIQIASSRELPQWDQWLMDLPGSHVLQSADWGAVKAEQGWQPYHLLMREGDVLRAMALLLVRRVRRFPWTIGYVPKGPCLDDPADLALWSRVLSALSAFSRDLGLVFLKVDPDVELGEGLPGQAMRDLLQSGGWTFSQEQIQYRNTVLLDLQPDTDELLSQMHAKTRYNIRLARRRGVEIREAGIEAAQAFYELYAETSSRDGFLIRPFSYYQSVWTRFLASGKARLWLAEHHGDLLAGILIFQFARRAWYMYGASSNDKRNLMPNYLLQWQAMEELQRDGVAVYDFWGAPDSPDESDPMWGVYRFKTGFGGRFVERIGAYDFPARRHLYWAYCRLMPRVLDLMRWRHARMIGSPSDGYSMR